MRLQPFTLELKIFYHVERTYFEVALLFSCHESLLFYDDFAIKSIILCSLNIFLILQFRSVNLRYVNVACVTYFKNVIATRNERNKNAKSQNELSSKRVNNVHVV